MKKAGTGFSMGCGLAVLAAAFSLAGCNRDANKNQGREPISNVGPRPGPERRLPQLSNSELTAAIALAVGQLNQRTPMQVDSVTTLTRVRAEGTNIIYEMAITQDFPSEQIEVLRNAAQGFNQTNLCRDPNTRRLIAMGGSMTHQYSVPGGDRFETRVSACPAA